MLLQEYRPKSKLQVKKNQIKQPRFPVIDGHNHLGASFGTDWSEGSMSELLETMDQVNVRRVIDLDGGWGEDILQKHLDHFKSEAPERFVTFGGVDWSRWADFWDRFPEWASRRLREQVKWGAQGLKIWKKFGLEIRDHLENLVPVDDVRLDPLWETAAELKIPVLIHVADPVAFFVPLDEHNERWEELTAHPDWHFPSPPFPGFMTIMNQLARLVVRHPQTVFIGAHLGCYSENLTWVADLLDKAPNFHVDISARISELGRQPYTARRFCLDYADRILFGTDMGPDPDIYRIYYRFLESDDEYFHYGTGEVPGQGRWRIYGLQLPDDVLEKIYYKNAMKILTLKGNQP